MLQPRNSSLSSIDAQILIDDDLQENFTPNIAKYNPYENNAVTLQEEPLPSLKRQSSFVLSQLALLN